MKIKPSEAKKKIKSTLDQIGLGEFWIKAHYMNSTGIVGTIRQRLMRISNCNNG